MRPIRIHTFAKAAVSTRRLQAGIIVCGCLALVYALFLLPRSTSAGLPDAEELTEAVEFEPAPAQGDYSRFTHSNATHARLPCLLCHKRDDNSARPKRSGHLPCAGCHTQQFSESSGPMCNICHTATGVKAFPPLRSFSVRFDHGRHLNQTNCATCHKPSRRGAALSVPAGASAHSTCYQCHTNRSDSLSSCSVCHQLGRPNRASDWARAFQMGFNHSEHTRGGKMNCATCHTVLRGAARGRQVTSPLAVMHFPKAGTQSCGNCHNSKRAFGISDFSNCKRCHEGKNFKF